MPVCPGERGALKSEPIFHRKTALKSVVANGSEWLDTCWLYDLPGLPCVHAGHSGVHIGGQRRSAFSASGSRDPPQWLSAPLGTGPTTQKPQTQPHRPQTRSDEGETMTTKTTIDDLNRQLTDQALHLWDREDSRLTPRQGSALAQTLSLWIDQDLDDMLAKNPTFDTPWNENGPFAHIDDIALVTIGDGVKPFVRQTQRVCRAHLERLDKGEMPLSHPELIKDASIMDLLIWRAAFLESFKEMDENPEFVSHVPQRPGDHEWDELIDEFDELIADRPVIAAVCYGTPTQVVGAIRQHPAHTWFAPSV